MKCILVLNTAIYICVCFLIDGSLSSILCPAVCERLCNNLQLPVLWWPRTSITLLTSQVTCCTGGFTTFSWLGEGECGGGCGHALFGEEVVGIKAGCWGLGKYLSDCFFIVVCTNNIEDVT